MIIANWKCNGSKSMINHWWKEFSKTYNETDNTFVVIAPPSIYIQYLENFTSNALTDIKIGSQDIDISSCLLYTSPSPRDEQSSRLPSSA